MNKKSITSDIIKGLREQTSIRESVSCISEGSTGCFGTEIGLPIDKENCEEKKPGSKKKSSKKEKDTEESTDCSGVATPTGVLGGSNEEEHERRESIQCPKCHSTNVNFSMGGKAHCVDCGTTWELHEETDEEKTNNPDSIDFSVNYSGNEDDENTIYSRVVGAGIDKMNESKKMIQAFEEYNAWKDCKKVSDKDVEKYRKQGEGVYTDGVSDCYYIAPKSGYSKNIKYKDFEFRYNYKNHELEVLDGKKKVLDAVGLSVGNWLDSPDYWIEDFYEDMSKNFV